MTLTFIHTADWQIGKPFRWFPPRMAGRLEAARLDAIDRIGELARKHSAAFVLVAGDIYDVEGLPRRERQQPLTRMKAFADITWVLLPGNHDPAAAGGIWSRLDGLLPDNIILADRAEPLALPGRDNVVILPAPLRQRLTSHDGTRWMDAAETSAGSLRVGLAHGSIQGFGSDDTANALIDPRRATSARLDYLALGDWHGMMQIDARTWYAGTPEPDRFSDNDAGYALVVSVSEPGALPKVEPVRTGQFKWAGLSEVLNDVGQLDGLASRFAALADGGLSRLLVRLTVSGGLSVEDLSAFKVWCDARDAELAYLAVRQDDLRVRGDLSSHPALEANADLARAAAMLKGLAAPEADLANDLATNPAAGPLGEVAAHLNDGTPVSAPVADAALMALVRAVEHVAEEGA